MPAFAAMLRAVNVGGTGRLAMADLARLCRECGFSHVQTYISSGNVVFTSSLAASDVHAALEERLAAFAGKPLGVLLRSAVELHQILAADPFPHAAGNQLLILFLDTPPAAGTLSTARHQTSEQIALGTRELYLHYPDGQGRSRLTLPALALGTARNRNTVQKLAGMAAALPSL